MPYLPSRHFKWHAKKKCDSPKYTLYKDALVDGLAKVGKYYSHLDKKPGFVLTPGKASKQIMREILV